MKEQAVADEFVNALTKLGDTRYSHPISAPSDPPDCIADYENGEVAAIEVTELVCQQTIEANEWGQEFYRIWTCAELIDAVSVRLDKKDSKAFLAGPYARTVIVIYTDEFDLNYNNASKWLEQHEFGRYVQIDEAYLLFSYNPNIKGYPLIRLKLKQAAKCHA